MGRVRLISRQSSDDISVRIVEICQPPSILLEYYYYAKVFRRLVARRDSIRLRDSLRGEGWID